MINVPLAIGCIALILTVIPPSAPRGVDPTRPARRIDIPGAFLCAAGLAGPVFALIEQPRLGWSSPGVIVPLVGGVAVFAGFLLYEWRASDPMLPLGLFRRRNFSAGNIETFSMYAGLSILFFFLVLFLQQIGGYSPLQSGLATLPVTIVMFLLSRRFGALADRYGPRLFMGAGPLVAAAGLLLFQPAGTTPAYLPEVCLPLILFSLGLSMTVAPLTAAVLAGAEKQAGIASGVNNAISRVAGLLGTASVGAAISASFAATFTSRLASTPLSGAGRAAAPKQSACRSGSLGARRAPRPGARDQPPRPKRRRCTPSTRA